MQNHPTSLVPCSLAWCTSCAGTLHTGRPRVRADRVDDLIQTLLVRLILIDDPDEQPTTYVELAARTGPAERFGELHPDRPLSPAGAAWLGKTLLELAEDAQGAARRTEAAGLAVDKINGPAEGDEYRRTCFSCGHDFIPDSTPNLVLCWECDLAQAIDTEANR